MPMTLSTTTFATDPSQMTMLRPDKICSYQLTYSSVAFFSWGATIVGKEIQLKWNAMPSTMFDNLDAILAADSTCIFQPKIPGNSTVTYEVNVLGLNGEYWINTESSAQYFRINCALNLLIMSEVAS